MTLQLARRPARRQVDCLGRDLYRSVGTWTKQFNSWPSCLRRQRRWRLACGTARTCIRCPNRRG